MINPLSLILLLYTGGLLVTYLEAGTTTAAGGGDGKVTTVPPQTNTGQNNAKTDVPSSTTEASSGTKAPVSSNSTVTTGTTENPNGTAQQPTTNGKNPVVTTNGPGTTQKPNATTTLKPVTTNAPETTQNPNATTTVKPVTTNAPVTTQNPNATTTVKPVTTNAPVTTQNPNATTTLKPVTTNAPVTTQKPNATTTVKPVTTNAPVTTQNPNATTTLKPVTTNAPVTTQKPNATTTLKPVTTNAPVTTQKPNATTTLKPVTTNAPVTSGSVTTQATTKTGTSTNKPSSTAPTGTTKVPETGGTTKSASSQSPSGQQTLMYINEIMLNKQGGFQKIELYTTNSDQGELSHYAMVMVDGSTNRTMSVTQLEMYQQTNGLITVSFHNDTNPMMKSEGIGVAIYDTAKMTRTFEDGWTVTKDGLVDALVIGKSYEQISHHLVQTLTPGMTGPFVLDPSLYGKEKTITRCSAELVRNTDMFALVNPSMGTDNSLKCKERLNFQHSLALKFTADCKMFDESDTGKVKTQRLVHYVIKEVNRKCHCGMTKMHIKDPSVSCCGGTDLNMKFVAPNQIQGDAILNNYKSFIQSTTDINVDGQLYKLDNSCYSNCCAKPTPSKQEDDSKNIKVTVAVVVTCVLIFLIIVILVVLYMRRKKTAVYQFRMSRLDEEEDYPMGAGEQDDFVGGQEATFDLKA